MKTKKEHYVPQFILKNFSFDRNMYIWCYDKQEEKFFKTNVLNIAAENNFYNVTHENGLAEIETETSKIIAEIIRNETLERLTSKEKEQLSYLFALQVIRTKYHRIRYKDIVQNLWGAIGKMGYKIEDFQGYKETSEEDIKSYGLRSLANAEDLSKYFFKKDWILFKTIEDIPFYISDNPVSMQNLKGDKIGLNVVGIELYFPLSKTLNLAMFCPSYKNKINEAYAKFKYIQQIYISRAKELVASELEYFGKAVFAYGTGKAIMVNKEIVENCNYLQVQNAERFVFSYNNNFSLVEDMIRESKNYKTGPRLEMN